MKKLIVTLMALSSLEPAVSMADVTSLIMTCPSRLPKKEISLIYNKTKNEVHFFEAVPGANTVPYILSILGRAKTSWAMEYPEVLLVDRSRPGIGFAQIALANTYSGDKVPMIEYQLESPDYEHRNDFYNRVHCEKGPGFAKFAKLMKKKPIIEVEKYWDYQKPTLALSCKRTDKEAPDMRYKVFTPGDSFGESKLRIESYSKNQNHDDSWNHANLNYKTNVLGRTIFHEEKTVPGWSSQENRAFTIYPFSKKNSQGVLVFKAEYANGWEQSIPLECEERWAIKDGVFNNVLYRN